MRNTKRTVHSGAGSGDPRTALVKIVAISLWGFSLTAWLPAAEETQYPDPARFEKDIQAFEAKDVRQPPPQQEIVCVGSSTMAMWHANIHADLAPLVVIARGFGGSTMLDLLHYADRIVTVYQPRAIVIYEGDNDVAQGIEPEKIHETFRALVRKIHHDLPQTRIYFLAIKPSASRWGLWGTAQRTNQLIADQCAQDALLTYVDIATSLLGADGKVRDELYLEDRLHLNRAGYEVLRDTLKPVLMKSVERSDGEAIDRVEQ